jgi:hypothetical protein
MMERHAVKMAGKRQLIEIRVTEPLTLASLVTYLTEATDLASEHGLRAFLVDTRGIATAMRPMEAIRAVEHLKTCGLPKGARIALVASPDDDSHEFIETAAQNRCFDLRCFNAEDAALSWLSA